MMSRQPSSEEITRVVMRLNSNKTPGPDGFTAGFYKAAWGTVGNELLASIAHFFTTAFLPKSVNATVFALIPKKPGASTITDYRPISLCNTVYKIISKLLVSRLKHILPDLILPNQSAFIKGRLLLENSVLANELVQGYHSNRGPPRITLKVDIAKAFDTVNWSFILGCLRAINVPETFIRWIEVCICTPSFSVGFNGTVHGYFKGKRGLRQGDPLSPYLFVIAMNVLSLLLNKAAREGRFGFHDKCEGLGLTHLCFADDLLIFSDGNINSLTNILSVLNEFQEVSGLAISIQKSSFMAAGIGEDQLALIKSTTGLSQANMPIMYLGLPLHSKKLSILNCAPLIEKIKARMNTWTVKTLSFAGRLQLLKSVVNGISNFWSSSFILPKKCIETINSMCSSFLWKGKVDSFNGARVAWSSITVSKSEGGLGLRDLLSWNKACIVRLIWLLFFRPSSLWVAWFRHHILKDELFKFWCIKPKQKFSWLTKKLLKMRDLTFPWIKLALGNGKQSLFWTSNWSPFGNLLKYVGPNSAISTGIPSTATLADLWTNENWAIPPARIDSMVEVQAFMSTIALNSQEDAFYWSVSNPNSRSFITGEIYDIIKNHKPVVPWRDEIWFSGGVPRHCFLSWLFVLNRCPTRDRLINWGISTDPLCLLCSSASENRAHLFFGCDFSWSIWEPIGRRLCLPRSRDWDSILTDLNALDSSSTRKCLSLLAWQSTIYSLWLERNNRLHRNSSRSSASMLLQIDKTIRNRASSLRDSRPKLASSLLQLWFYDSCGLNAPLS